MKKVISKINDRFWPKAVIEYSNELSANIINSAWHSLFIL